MLEEPDWEPFDEGKEWSFQTARQIVTLRILIRYLRERHKKPEQTDKFLRHCETILMSEEQMREFLEFYVRCPHMSVEKLAERMMVESEYIYGVERNVCE